MNSNTIAGTARFLLMTRYPDPFTVVWKYEIKLLNNCHIIVGQEFNSQMVEENRKVKSPGPILFVAVLSISAQLPVSTITTINIGGPVIKIWDKEFWFFYNFKLEFYNC